MNDYPEIQIGRERNDAGEMLVRVGDVLCGTVDNLKRMIDEEVERETLRKLRAAGVTLTMVEGEPQINVPAAASHLVKVEPRQIPAYGHLEFVGGQLRVVIDQMEEVAATFEKIERENAFVQRVHSEMRRIAVEAVRDAQKRRAL